MNFWAPFLHFYQPPTQESHILREINDTCYEPLFNMLLENSEYKITFNINSILLDLLRDHGLEHTIQILEELVKKKQVEIVGTGKYHPILPLIPKKEVLRQISLQERDLKSYFPSLEKSGFFPPEMAISPGLASIVSNLGYKWILSSGIACSADWAYNQIYQTSDGLLLYFRDDIISNEISFQKISVDFFLDKLKVLYKDPHYVITAQDGETFGHHVPGYERIFLKKALDGAIIDEEIELCWISDLDKHFKVTERISPVSSSWSTSYYDLKDKVPFPLWNHPDNPIHRLQFKLLKTILEIVYIA
ncbi:MAG: hypothetical protein ACTSYS_05575, partial [Promethearchaeota archaeon]